MIVGQFIERRAGRIGQRHRERPVEFVHVEQGPLGPREFDDRLPGRDACRQHRFVIQQEQRPQRVLFLANRENLVFGVPRPDDVGGVDFNQPIGDLAGRVAVPRRRRREGLGDPVRQRHSDVEIFSLEDQRQFGQGTVDMRFARVPTQVGKVDPAPQRHGHLDRFVADRHVANFGKVLFAALDREPIAARCDAGEKRGRRDRRVLLDRARVDPIRLVVPHRGRRRSGADEVQ